MMPIDQRKYLEDTLRFLCRDSRVAGSDWNKIVCDYLRDEYAGFGYQTEVEESSFTGWELESPPQLRYLTPPHKPSGEALPVVWSGGTKGPVTGRVHRSFPGVPRTIKTFEAYDWDVFPVADHTNTLVACLISGPQTWMQPRDNDYDRTPYLMIPDKDAAFIRACLDRDVEIEVEVSINSRCVPGQTLRNVIARTSPGKSSIIISAHYDSFFNTTGFHDNASGTAVLLALARRIAAVSNGRIAFVGFDGEEWNKLGSYRFVEKRRLAGDLSLIRAVLNIDSVGVGTSIYVAAAKSLLADVTQAARGVSSAVPFYLQPLENMPQFDTWPFMRSGIPAVQVGSQCPRPFRHWHSPQDNIALLSEQTYVLMEAILSLAEGLTRVWSELGD